MTAMYFDPCWPKIIYVILNNQNNMGKKTMLIMSSFNAAMSRVKKKQKNANKFWMSVWHQAVAQAASKDRNLALLNVAVNSVHSVPGMMILPLVEAVLSIGGKDEKSEFPGMIAVEITKDGGGSAHQV